ncbi:MAG: glycosyltransferase [Clostridia bacterium]
MYIAMITVGATGHVYSAYPIIAALVQRGVRVSCFTSANFEKTIRATGAEFYPINTVLTNQGKAKDDIEKDMMAELPLRFLSDADVAIQQILPILQKDKPDAILSDAFAIAGRLASKSLGVPLIMLHTSYMCNEHFSVTSSWPNIPDTHPARATAKKLAESFSRDYGVEPSGVFEIFEGRGDLDIVTQSRMFHPAGETFDDRTIFAGAQIGPRAGDGEWVTPIQNNDPIIYASLGTLFNNWPEFFMMLSEAVDGLPVQLIASIGTHIKPEMLGKLADNMVVAPFWPQLDVLKKASLFITHAGTGSVMEAIYFGVPMLAVPQMDEQFLTASLMAKHGLGKMIPDKGMITPALLRDSIRQLLADETCRQNVKRFQDDMLRVNGSEFAAEEILRFLKNP